MSVGLAQNPVTSLTQVPRATVPYSHSPRFDQPGTPSST